MALSIVTVTYMTVIISNTCIHNVQFGYQSFRNTSCHAMVLNLRYFFVQILNPNISPKFCFSNVKSNKIIFISQKLLRQCKNKLLRDRSTQISPLWVCGRKSETFFGFALSYSLSQLYWLKSSQFNEIGMAFQASSSPSQD